MQIELGKKYITREGMQVTITEHDKDDSYFPYMADTGCWYTIDGFRRSTESESPHDLVSDAMITGRKDDGGKLDLTLLFDDCPHALEAVAEVLQWAITKKQPVPYKRGSWQGVDDFQRRYRAAMQRHMLNAAKSNMGGNRGALVGGFEAQRDAETGLLELAHIATDAMFMLEMAIRKERGL